MQAALGRAITDIAYLMDLCRSLETFYKSAPES